MNKITAVLIFSIAFFTRVWSQIPAERLYSWANYTSIEDTTQWSNIPTVDFATFPSSGTDDDKLNAIWNQWGSDSIQIYFSSGDYFFENTIVLGNWCRLIGDGPAESRLHFNPVTSRDFIRSSGSRTSDTLQLQGLTVGDNSFSLPSAPNWFTPGIELYVIDNDIALVTSAWATGTSGQLIRIDSISGSTAYFSPSIRRNFQGTTVLHRLEMVERPALAQLELINHDSASMQTSNIEFTYVRHAQVSCVTSRMSNFAHLSMNYCRGGSISRNAFLDAHSHGGGGRGYGVVLQYASGDVAVFENYFDHLRHSILLQAGANGNAVLYNYSSNPFWTETSLPDDSPGELVLHGNYPYVNLFEGNLVNNIVVDDSHGVNGPDNVFFRNRASGYGIFMNFLPPSDSQIYVGNVVDPGVPPLGLYFLNGSGHFTYGNATSSGIMPAGTGSPVDASLFFDSAPDYYSITNQWPLVDPITTPGTIVSNLPSALVNGSSTGSCLDFLSVSDADEAVTETLTIWPNPTSNVLRVSGDGSYDINTSLAIFNSFGQCIWRGCLADFPLNVAHWTSGVYYLQLGNARGAKFVVQ